MDREHTKRLDMPFVGIPTFLRTEYFQDLDRLEAEVAVMGVPFHEGVPFMDQSRALPNSGESPEGLRGRQDDP